MITVELHLSVGKFVDDKFIEYDSVDFECDRFDRSDSINEWLNHQYKDSEFNYAELRFQILELERDYLIASFKTKKFRNKSYWILTN